MAIKVIHTADWQIGKTFGNIPGDAGAMLREQRFQTIRLIAELARNRAVDAVLVAGDVFDGNAVKDETIRRAIKRDGRISGTLGVAARQPRRCARRKRLDADYALGCSRQPAARHLA